MWKKLRRQFHLGELYVTFFPIDIYLMRQDRACIYLKLVYLSRRVGRRDQKRYSGKRFSTLNSSSYIKMKNLLLSDVPRLLSIILFSERIRRWVDVRSFSLRLHTHTYTIERQWRELKLTVGITFYFSLLSIKSTPLRKPHGKFKAVLFLFSSSSASSSLNIYKFSREIAHWFYRSFAGRSSMALNSSIFIHSLARSTV